MGRCMVLVLGLPTFCSAAERRNIAVLDLDANGIITNEAFVLSEKLRDSSCCSDPANALIRGLSTKPAFSGMVRNGPPGLEYRIPPGDPGLFSPGHAISERPPFCTGQGRP